eukprot:NODE_17292_length_951_cov_3.671117.p1 GENE.NODE_17292_length_951_cov_3.671117~~NODE_17292_length_951_cov_3.671117.p1  ORF type:complete len:270 (-),score=53.55 NODE_17292_length_951_cov_3.671117:26-835(-)
MSPIRAGTARVELPRAVGRVFSQLRGHVNHDGDGSGLLRSWPPELWFFDRLKMYTAHCIGLPSSYFEGPFLDGAKSALHFAAETLNEPDGEALREAAADSPLAEQLRKSWLEGLEGASEAELRLKWDIEDIVSTRAGPLGFTIGGRRSHLPGSVTDIHLTTFDELDSSVLAPRGKKPSPVVSFFKHGGMIYAEAFVTARQTVGLMREDGEAVASEFSEATTHRLRFEAELIQGNPPFFDAEHGWSLLAVNRQPGERPFEAQFTRAPWSM